MKTCPNCETDLMAADRQGIEIDHCPRCRGVWLDRGELEKIIERSTQRYDDDDDDDDDSDWGRDRGGYHGPTGRQHGSDPRGGYPPRKKPGFFSRLFEFD